MIRLVCVFLLALATPSLEQGSVPQSPCPEVFTYEPAGSDPGQWYGVARLPKGSILHSLNIVLDGRADKLENWVGDVRTRDNIDFQITNSDTGISPDPIISVRFFVQYNPLMKTPRLQTLKLNGRDICSSDTSVITRRPVPAAEGPATPPNFATVSPAPRPPRPPAPPGSGSYQVQCGSVVLKHSPKPLITFGKPTLDGQWPWHIAIYTAENTDNKYTCGGTLVSRKHIITAGHCVTTPQTQRPISENTITIYLGRHNLRTWTRNVQIRFVRQHHQPGDARCWIQVDRLMVHPEFKGETLKHDLAIIELSEAVTYTNWVRPVCLWPDTRVQQSNVIGQTGSVVGWGKTEKGVASEELYLVEMPVVDTDTCVSSYEDFFLRFTSQYTYCAGARNGSSVCNGDSGGGMFFKSEEYWYLRGLVSLSVGKVEDNFSCDTSHYVVFTDLAQYLPWIKRNIL